MVVLRVGRSKEPLSTTSALISSNDPGRGAAFRKETGLQNCALPSVHKAIREDRTPTDEHGSADWICTWAVDEERHVELTFRPAEMRMTGTHER
jgi:hypothetical protein